ncbi:unnamed protein product [Musa hybrid cultivar]
MLKNSSRTHATSKKATRVTSSTNKTRSRADREPIRLQQRTKKENSITHRTERGESSEKKSTLKNSSSVGRDRREKEKEGRRKKPILEREILGRRSPKRSPIQQRTHRETWIADGRRRYASMRGREAERRERSRWAGYRNSCSLKAIGPGLMCLNPVAAHNESKA